MNNKLIILFILLANSFHLYAAPTFGSGFYPQECSPFLGAATDVGYASLRVELYGHHPVKNYMSSKRYYEKFISRKTENVLCTDKDGNILFDQLYKALGGLPLEAKSEYLRYGNWFLNNQRIKKFNDIKFSVWLYKFDYDRYGLKSGWVSSLAQGFGIQVLVRSYLMTGSAKYLEAAKLAAESYKVGINNGGILHVDSKGYHWYEEYPSSPRSFVLNGFVLSLFGIFELAELTGNKEYYDIFESGVKTLEAHLSSYFMPPNRAKYDLVDSMQRFRLTPEINQLLLIGDVVLEPNPSTGSGATLYKFPVDTDGDPNITKNSLGVIVKEGSHNSYRELLGSTDLYLETPKAVDIYGYSKLEVNVLNFDSNLKVEIFNGYRYIRLSEIQRVKHSGSTVVSFDLSNAYLRGKEAHIDYVKLHSEILRDLNRITDKDVFDKYAILWSGVE